MGPEELRAIKESVNKEGTQMEEGEEGGAAVYVGTKEEVTKARQLAETEGRAPDLASYIVMHKEVLVKSDELQNYGGSDFAKVFGEAPIGAMHLEKYIQKPILYFKDSLSNLAKVEIDVSKVPSLKSKLSTCAVPDGGAAFHVVLEELKGLGFSSDHGFEKIDFWGLQNQITKSRLNKIRDERKKGFAF